MTTRNYDDLYPTHYLINTPKITFNKDQGAFYVLPGNYLMEMFLNTRESIETNEEILGNVLTIGFKNDIENTKIYLLRRLRININGFMTFIDAMESQLIIIKNKSKIIFSLLPIPISNLTFILRPFDAPINTF